MTTKRFTVKGLSITEHSNQERKYYLHSQNGVNGLCLRLNQLYAENQKLKKELASLQKQ